MSFQTAKKVYFNMDGSILRETPANVIGGGNGAVGLYIIAPFSNDLYTCGVNFKLPNGQIKDTRVSFPFLGREAVEVNGVTENWYVYYRTLPQELTVEASHSLATPLDCTTVFKEIANPNVESPMTLFNIQIQGSVQTGVTILPTDDKLELQGQIDNKRDKNPIALPSITNENNIRQYTSYDATAGQEVKETFEELRDRINIAATPTSLYPTTSLSDIDDTVLGQKFRKNVTSTSDVDYNSVVQEVTLTPSVAGVFENLFSLIAPLGFINGTLTDISFETTLESKTSGTSADFRLDYYKRDALGNETLIIQGTPKTITNTTYNSETIKGKITNISIDADAGERLVSRVYVQTTTTGNSVLFRVGGTNAASFTDFQLPFNTTTATKKDKNFSALGDRVLKSRTDGNDEETNILISNLALLDAIQTFLGKITIDDSLDVAQDLLVNGTTTIQGNLIVNGTQTILDTVTLEVEDNIIQLAQGQTSGLVDIGFNGDRGTDTNIFMGWQESTDLFKIGLVDNLKRIATIVDNPNINQIFVYDNVTGNLVTKTASEIKTLLSLDNVDNTSDLNKPISTATQNALNAKLERFLILNQGQEVGNVKELNFIGGSSVVLDGSDRAIIDIFGEGIGEGVITSGEVDGIPITAVPVTPTLISFDTIRQSNDIDVFQIFDKDDIPTNIFRVKKTATTELGNPLFYKFLISGTAVNNDTSTSRVLTFTIERNSVPIKTEQRTISKASGTTPATNNFTIEIFIQTNPLNVTEDYQVKINSTSTLVDLTRYEASFSSDFVSGEALPDVMRTTIYDVNKVGKVDLSQLTDKIKRNEFTLDSGADVKASITGNIVDKGVLLAKLPIINSSNALRISLDDGVTYYPVIDKNGNAILGTDASQNTEWLMFNSAGNNFIAINSNAPVYTTIDTLQDITNHFPQDTYSSKLNYRVNGLTLNQLVTNGNFANGTVGWTVESGLCTSSNEKYLSDNSSLKCVASGSGAYVSKSLNINFGDTYFIYWNYYLNSYVDGNIFAQIGNSPQIASDYTLNKWHTMSVKITPTATPNAFIGATSGTFEGYFDNFMAINMTQHNIENYTEQQMLALCQTYFEGIKHSTPSVLLQGKNIFDKSTVTVDNKIDNTTGLLSASVGNNASDYISINPTLSYVLSGLTNTVVIEGAYYDINKNYISGFTSYVSLAIPTNAYYIRFTIINDDLNTTQLEQNTVATTYEPYISNTYAINRELRSLPNGVADTHENSYEINNYLYDLGKTTYTQRIGVDNDISGIDYDTLDTVTYTNVDVVKTTVFNLAKVGTTGVDNQTRYVDKNGNVLLEEAQTNIDLVASVGKYYWHTDGTLWIIVTKGAYVDITGARTDLGTTTLDYELATTIVTELDYPELFSYGYSLIQTGDVVPIDYSLPSNLRALIEVNERAINLVNERLDETKLDLIDKLTPETFTAVLPTNLQWVTDATYGYYYDVTLTGLQATTKDILFTGVLEKTLQATKDVRGADIYASDLLDISDNIIPSNDTTTKTDKLRLYAQFNEDISAYNLLVTIERRY